MNLGSTFVALETSGRVVGLDYQLLFDAAITAINVFILFLLFSVILFNPVRNMLKKRQDKITSDRETAEKNREDALAMKAEYEEKLKAANKEAELILSDARKTAMHNEQKIIDEAKEEAARILSRANAQVELERKAAADDMKKEMIALASLMAEKAVAGAVDAKVQDTMVESTLKEIGEDTWRK